MRLRQICESSDINHLLAPLSKNHGSALRKLLAFNGKPTPPHDILEDRLEELASNKRLVAMFMSSSAGTKPSDIDESELPPWCGISRIGETVLLFKKGDEDVVDAMSDFSLPGSALHAVRGIVFGYNLDDVVDYSLKCGLDDAWEALLEDDGFVLADGSENSPDGIRGYSSVFRSNRPSWYYGKKSNSVNSGSIVVWHNDMDRSDFINKALKYGEPAGAYERDGTLIYPGFYSLCCNCGVMEDLLNGGFFIDGCRDGQGICPTSECSCDRSFIEYFACILLNDETMFRLNSINRRLAIGE